MFNVFIHNFRSFQHQKLNLSRINILIGENSSGKSSLLKLLLALKQTLDSPTESNLKFNGELTDLGNFEEAVYHKNKNRKIKLGFSLDSNYFPYFLNFIDSYFKRSLRKDRGSKVKKMIFSLKQSKTDIAFEFSSKLNDHASIKTRIKNDLIGALEILTHRSSDDGNNRQLTCSLKYNIKGKVGILENCIAFKEGFLTLLDPSFEIACEKKFKEESDFYFFHIVYLLVTQNFLQDEIQRMVFVNPIGSVPKRFYFQYDKQATYRTTDIEKLVNVLSDPALNKRTVDERIKLLNRTLKSFGIAEEVALIKDKQLPILALNVKTKDFWSNINDVGYGVSLQIPILFQALISENYTKEGQTILIEQPEVHLHPHLQAKFIETLLSIGDKNSYFIETHSEHIVRKLQVLVKSRMFNLSPSDITVHYFKREIGRFQITEHFIGANGSLEPGFPEGFYDTSYSLVKALIK